MKKRICLFAIMLSILALPASALDISIAGKPYPAFLFIPLALILFVWLAVMFKWLLNNFSRIALFFYNIGKFVSAFGFRLGITRLKEKIKQKPLMEEPVEGKAKEIPKEEATKDLTPFIEKINTLERKLEHSKEPDAIFRELTPLIKDFFKALLNIHYEFTDDEMVDVLEKKKKHLVEFANKISELKYSGKKQSPKEVNDLVKEFKGIVHKYVETGWKPKRVAKGVVERLAEQDKKIFDNVKQYVGFLGGESRKMQIESLLDDEQEILKRNIGSMKRTYNRILRMYVQLSPNEKAAVYPQLVEFYKNANKAIFSSVYGEKSKKELEYFVKELQRLKEMPKMQPWLAKVRMFFSPSIDKSEKLSRKEEKKLIVPKPSELGEGRHGTKVTMPSEIKLKGKKTESKPEPLSMKPLFEKLAKIFKPEQMPEKKAKKMLAPKEPKLKEPTIKPFIERLEEFKDSAKKLFSRIPTKAVKVEKLVVPKAPVETANAIEKIGKMLEETPAIEQVDYMKKVENNISKAWNLIAVADFKAFDDLYEKIKLDYVNLNDNEKQVMDQRLTTLLDAETKAKTSIEARKQEEERISAEQKGRQAEEALQTGIRTREREAAQKEAREMVSEIQRELEEEQEIKKEEEILLRLEEQRKQKEREAGITNEKKEITDVLKKVDEGFKEKDEIDREEEELLSWWEKRKLRKERQKAQRITSELEKQHQEQEELNKEEELLQKLEAERKQKEAKAYTLKEKSKIRAELRQIDRLFKERKKLELEALARERKAEAQRKRIETTEKKKQQQVLTPELSRIDSIFRQKQKEELEEQRRIAWEEQRKTAEERKKTQIEEIAEMRLKQNVEEHIKRDKLIRQREAEALKREEERRRIELDKRRHVSDRLRIEKEKEWKSSVHGKSLDSLEELQNQLRSVIVNLERKPTAPSEGIKDRLEREAEVVRKEVEAKRASDLKRITIKEEIKKKKKALSPLEEEQLKLILELERISKGL